MASAIPQHDAPSRSWWSMKHQPQRYPSEKQKSKSPLNSLASAFGLKSKKTPTLTIEDPPLPIQSPPALSPLSPKLGNRPPSKSVSSTLSRADSAGPLTPSDVTHHNVARHSLLTLSDIDPFAGRGVVTISTTDPTRLSAYSTNSGQDFAPAKSGEHPSPNDRISYASSSSVSQSHATVNANELKRTLSPLSPTDSYTNRRLLKKLSETNLERNNSYSPNDKYIRQSPVQQQQTLHKSGSSNTLNSSRYGPPVKRPVLRPRGMTDNGASTQKSGFFIDPKPTVSSPTRVDRPPPSASKPISPRVIIRQASLQRLNPPAAPPRHGLPATPHSPVKEDDDPSFLAPAVSTASSTISFASSTSSRELYPHSPMPLERPRRISDRSFFTSGAAEVDRSPPPDRPSAPQSPPPTQTTLKKALSHQSLRKRTALFSSPSQLNHNPPDTEKTPQKHRVFPHPRIPIPPIPISLRQSNSSHSGLAEHNASTTEQKRTSSSSHGGGGRKRLFSGSSLRRPSTSHSNQGDDDTQSVFSVKSDQDMYINTAAFFKPWISTQSSSSSFWEEATPETVPNSPTRAHNDIPQQPTSPRSALRKLEISSPRHRGLSIRSTETVASLDKVMDHSVSPHNTTAPLRLLGRSNTVSRVKPETAKHTLIGRPATAQPILQPQVVEAVPDPIEHNYKPSVSPPPLITSLPPPPRRKRAAVVSQPEPEPVKAEPEPILEPPAIVSLPPPPSRHNSRIKPPGSMEKALHRRSIMKKPSFLEIEDDSDDDDVVVYRKDIGDSFLDFARESFDTVRST